MFFVLAVDAELHQQLFDLRGAEIGHRRFDLQRQIDADALAAEADFLDGAVERLLLSADANDFQGDRWVGLLERRDRELIPAGKRHVGDDADLFLPRGWLRSS